MKRVPALDGIRGIAILVVVAGHVASNYQPMEGELRRWLVVFTNSDLGVRLFFVLSGYLITSLLLQEHTARGTISLKAFYLRRVLRIFPAFYAYLLMLLVLSLWIPCGLTPSTWAASATFTWNYAHAWVNAPAEGTWNVGHFWTLALEEQFYLLWPITLRLAGLRRALYIAVGLVVWCPLARVGTYFLFPAERGYLEMMFHTGSDSIMVGCAAALLMQSASMRQKFARVASAGAWVAGCWMFVLSPLSGALLRGFPVVAGFTLDALAAAWIILWARQTLPTGFGKLLGSGLLPALGTISYSLYLWQQIFLSPTGWLATGRVLPACGAAVAVACLSYWLIEKPALRLKNRRGAPPSA